MWSQTGSFLIRECCNCDTASSLRNSLKIKNKRWCKVPILFSDYFLLYITFTLDTSPFWPRTMDRNTKNARHLGDSFKSPASSSDLINGAQITRKLNDTWNVPPWDPLQNLPTMHHDLSASQALLGPSDTWRDKNSDMFFHKPRPFLMESFVFSKLVNP